MSRFYNLSIEQTVVCWKLLFKHLYWSRIKGANPQLLLRFHTMLQQSNSCGLKPASVLGSLKRTHTDTHTRTGKHAGGTQCWWHRTLLTLALQFNIYFRDFHAVQQKDCCRCLCLFRYQKRSRRSKSNNNDRRSFCQCCLLCSRSRGMWTQHKQTDTCISWA